VSWSDDEVECVGEIFKSNKEIRCDRVFLYPLLVGLSRNKVTHHISSSCTYSRHFTTLSLRTGEKSDSLGIRKCVFLYSKEL